LYSYSLHSQKAAYSRIIEETSLRMKPEVWVSNPTPSTPHVRSSHPLQHAELKSGVMVKGRERTVIMLLGLTMGRSKWFK
jgi:hypothetical protein